MMSSPRRLKTNKERKRMSDKLKFIGTKIPTDQHKRLAKIAAGNQRSLGAEVRLAIIRHLKGGVK